MRDLEKHFPIGPKFENPNLYRLDRVSNMPYQMMLADGNRTRGLASGTSALPLHWNAPTAELGKTKMKIHSATSTGAGNRNQFPLPLPRKENILLVASVALAFIFVTACIFTLG
jgi:hypothetical protein